MSLNIRSNVNRPLLGLTKFKTIPPAIGASQLLQFYTHWGCGQTGPLALLLAGLPRWLAN